MRAILLFTLFTALTFNACTNPSTTSDKSTENAEKAAEKKVEPTKKYTLTPFSSSTAYPDATIESMSYQKGKFDFKVSGKAYKLGAQTPDAAQKRCANSDKGQHIHLIVDDAPYAAKYTASFEHDVADGEHHLLAFLSRSYHESIKTKAASKVEKVMVKNKTITSSTPIEDPMLFYSRPKGTYTGAANTERVMLDFFLANLELGEGYTVVASINGEDHEIKKWQPYYIEGLPMGENTVKLSLMKDGALAKTPLNPVTRVFTLAEAVEDKIMPKGDTPAKAESMPNK